MFKKDSNILIQFPSLISYWDFEGVHPLTAKGKFPYELKPGNRSNNTPKLINGALSLAEGEYFYIPRAECEALNISGPDAQVTVLAWVKRKEKSFIQCEAIAGMWNETEKKRQYCLFLNLRLFDSADQVCGHISGVGGPTPGEKWCIDASIGKQKVEYRKWTFVAFTYDGQEIRSYLNGKFDAREGRNPYAYDSGIYDGGENGSDFTVGAVHRLGEMGNDFVGEIAGLAVFDRALNSTEVEDIHHEFNMEV